MLDSAFVVGRRLVTEKVLDRTEIFLGLLLDSTFLVGCCFVTKKVLGLLPDIVFLVGHCLVAEKALDVAAFVPVDVSSIEFCHFLCARGGSRSGIDAVRIVFGGRTAEEGGDEGLAARDGVGCALELGHAHTHETYAHRQLRQQQLLCHREYLCEEVKGIGCEAESNLRA